MWLTGLTAVILGVKLSQTIYSDEPCHAIEVSETVTESQSTIGSVSTFCRYVQNDNNTWTIIHRRVDGTLNFTRTWEDYRDGFGDLQGEYWLGLEKIHQLTQTGPHKLMVVLKDYDDVRMWALYDKFRVLSEVDQYELEVGQFSAGDAEDSLKEHNAMKFSTPDRDNDMWSGNCAELYESGWWFKNCHAVNLNGIYQDETEYDKMMWGKKSLKEAQMMIRVDESSQ
ncbi:angiopoietin-related protein 6-like [Aedes aegypti]|uniref:Fibrinogen C-terminal domain-containing protein n=1 Tax=Aedes aegypti TaxID=7159 RepID=A0A903VPJ3_AEDAE|nr:angiopoietin-related protein 6-like [Aedes aegypti]